MLTPRALPKDMMLQYLEMVKYLYTRRTLMQSIRDDTKVCIIPVREIWQKEKETQYLKNNNNN